MKKPRFPNILGPPRRLSRVDSTSGEEKTAFYCFTAADAERGDWLKTIQTGRNAMKKTSSLPAVGKAVELNKPRSPKPLSQPTFAIPEQSDSSTPNHGRVRGNQLSEGSDTSTQSLPSTTSPTLSPPTSQASDTSGQDSDSSKA